MVVHNKRKQMFFRAMRMRQSRKIAAFHFTEGKRRVCICSIQLDTGFVDYLTPRSDGRGLYSFIASKSIAVCNNARRSTGTYMCEDILWSLSAWSNILCKFRM